MDLQDVLYTSSRTSEYSLWSFLEPWLTIFTLRLYLTNVNLTKLQHRECWGEPKGCHTEAVGSSKQGSFNLKDTELWNVTSHLLSVRYSVRIRMAQPVFCRKFSSTWREGIQANRKCNYQYESIKHYYNYHPLHNNIKK